MGWLRHIVIIIRSIVYMWLRLAPTDRAAADWTARRLRDKSRACHVRVKGSPQAQAARRLVLWQRAEGRYLGYISATSRRLVLWQRAEGCLQRRDAGGESNHQRRRRRGARQAEEVAPEPVCLQGRARRGGEGGRGVPAPAAAPSTRAWPGMSRGQACPAASHVPRPGMSRGQPCPVASHVHCSWRLRRALRGRRACHPSARQRPAPPHLEAASRGCPPLAATGPGRAARRAGGKCACQGLAAPARRHRGLSCRALSARLSPPPPPPPPLLRSGRGGGEAHTMPRLASSATASGKPAGCRWRLAYSTASTAAPGGRVRGEA